MTAFGRSRFVDTADGVRVSVFGGHDLLTAIPQHLFIPDNRFEKPLQRPWSHVLIQSDRFRILTLHVGKQATRVDQQQRSSCRSSETTGETSQKPEEQFAQLCDILHRHGTTFRGFLVKRFSTRRVVPFLTSSQVR